MASYSESSEQGAREVQVSREQGDARVVGHMGATCDDCGCSHGAYAVEQLGASYLLCESCYEYATIVVAVDSDHGAEPYEDDFAAEEAADWLSDDEEEIIVGSNRWWADGEQDARDNGAYGLLVGGGRW